MAWLGIAYNMIKTQHCVLYHYLLGFPLVNALDMILIYTANRGCYVIREQVINFDSCVPLRAGASIASTRQTR